MTYTSSERGDKLEVEVMLRHSSMTGSTGPLVVPRGTLQNVSGKRNE